MKWNYKKDYKIIKLWNTKLIINYIVIIKTKIYKYIY
jgi:hypothetical protein